MKNFYFLIISLLAGLFGNEVNSQCDYTISMQDTWGDGWNGGAVSIRANGSVVGSWTLGTGNSGTDTYTAADGDELEFEWVQGSYDGEISFNIVSPVGIIIYDGGAPGAGPFAGDIFVNPACGPPVGTPITSNTCYDFNAGTGDFTNGLDGAAWVQGLSGTPSGGTGPTSGSDGSPGFMFTEASYGAGSTVFGMQGFFDLSGFTSGGFSIDYHQNGNNCGNIEVWINGVTVWASPFGNLGNTWFTSPGIDLAPYAGNPEVYISIIGRNGGGYASDMAVDNACFSVPPSCASNLSPANGATTQPTALTLSWNPVNGADSYDVYFGTLAQLLGGSMTLLSNNQIGTSYAHSGLAYLTTYYWRVVPANVAGEAIGCSEISFTTDAAPIIPPVADFSASTTSINVGESVTFTDLTTENPTNWAWSVSPSTSVTYSSGSSSSQNPVISFGFAGTYTITLTATNASGDDTEVKTDYITVSCPSNLTVTYADVSHCSGNTSTLTGSVTDPGESYTYTFNGIDSYGDGWNGNMVNILVDGSLVVDAFTFSSGTDASTTFSAGIGSVITLSWTPGSYASEVSWNIEDPSGAQLSSGIVDETAGGTTSYSTASYTYSWDPSTGLDNASSASPVASNTSSETYTVTVTNQLGCTGTDAVFAEVTSPTAGTLSGTTSINVGGTSTISSDGTTGGEWTSDNTSVATVDISTGVVTGVMAGSATITYAVGGTLCPDSETIAVSVSCASNITASYGDVEHCSGQSSVLTGSISDPNTQQTYTLNMYDSYGDGWNGSLLNITLNGSAVLTDATLGAGSSGSTTFTAAPGDVLTLAWSSLSYPSEITFDMADPSGTVLASGNTDEISATLGTGTVTYTYSWDPSTGLDDASLASPTTSASTPTTYILTVTSSVGCTGSATANLTISAPDAGVISGTTSVYAGQSSTLSSDGTSGGEWTSDNTSVATVDISTGVVTGISTGTANITYTVGGGTCPDAETISFSVIIESPNNCYDMSTLPGPAVNGANGTLLWTAGSAGTPSANTGPQSGDADGGSGFYFTEATSYPNTVHDMSFNFDLSSASDPSFNFSYHMYSAVSTLAMGTLEVIVDGSSVWSLTGDQGNSWQSASISIDPATVSNSSLVNVIVRGTTSADYTSDMAIDNICILDCESVGTISGVLGVCAPSTTQLSQDGATGGTWSSDNGNATVDAAGLVTGVADGTSTITYTIAAAGLCSESSSSAVVDVSVLTSSYPDATTCSGVPVLLSGTYVGNGVTFSWSPTTDLDDATIAIPTSSYNSPFVPITYTLTLTDDAGCTITDDVALAITPLDAGTLSATSTTFAVAETSTVSTDGTTGGTFVSSDVSVATVDPVTGVVTGVTAGSVTITYTTPECSGTTYDSQISLTIACDAGTTSLTSSSINIGETSTASSSGTPGGSYSSDNTAVATVDASTGVVTGVTAGTANILYTTSVACGEDNSSVAITVSCASDITVDYADDSEHCPGQSSTLTGSYVDPNDPAPSYTFNGIDSYGDGWNGNAVDILVDGSVVESGFTFTSGTGASTTFSAAYGSAITLSWTTGSYTSEVSWNITADSDASEIGTGAFNESPSMNVPASSVTYTYSWSPSADLDDASSASPVASNTLTETYSVTITSSIGCTGSDDALVTVVNPSAGTLSGTTSINIGGTTTISSDGNVGGEWTSDNTAVATVDISTGVVTGVTAGSATVTYAVGGVTCPDSETITITVSCASDLTVVYDDVSHCSGNTSTITGSVSDPGETWTYTFNGIDSYGDGWNGNTVDILVDGSVVESGFTFTTGAGASTTFSAGVGSVITLNWTEGSYATEVSWDIQDPSGAQLSAGIFDETAGGTTTYDISGQTYTYSWDPSTGLDDASIASPVASNTSSETYTVTVTSPLGCTGTDAVFAEVNNPTAGNLSGTSTINPGGTTTISSDGTTGGEWTSDNTAVATVDISTGIVTGVTAGSATITYAVGGILCPDSETIAITVVCASDLTVTYDDVSHCLGNTSTLTGSVTDPGESYTYTFNGIDSYGDGWNGNAVDILVDGSVVESGFTFTSGTGASTTFSAGVGSVITLSWTLGSYDSEVSWTIDDPSGAQLSTGAFNATAGGTTSYSTASYTYSWDPSTGLDNASSASPVASNTTSTTYTLTVTSPLGCTGTDAVFAEIFNPTAGTLSGTTTINPGGITTISSDGTAGGEWTSDNTAVATVDISTGVVTGGVSGSATITYSVGGVTCPDSETITINVVCANWTIDYDDVAYCNGTSTTMNQTLNSQANTYEFYGVDSWGDGWNGASVDISVNGVTVLTGVEVPADNASFYFDAPDGATIGLNWTSGDYNSEITWGIYDVGVNLLDNGAYGVTSSTIPGTAPTYTYAWTPSTGLDDASIMQPTVSATSSESYSLTITDANGCTASTSAQVNVEEADPISMTVGGSSASDAADMRLDQDVTWTNSGTGGTSTLGYIWDADESDPYSGYAFVWTNNPQSWSDNEGDFLNGGDSRTLYVRSRVENNGVTCYSDAMSVILRKPLVSTSGALTAFSNCSGTESTEQSFTLTGQYLTNAIDVTAPTGYEVSKTPTSGYASSISYAPTNGDVSDLVYVRVAAATTGGTPSGDVTCSTTYGPVTPETVSATVAATSTVTDVPSVASTTDGSSCGEGTVDLSATGSAGTINWYADATGGASLGSGDSFTTPSLSTTTDYYVDATDGSCITDSRTAVTASIFDNPVAGSLTVDLTEALSTETINWTNSGSSGGTVQYYYAWNDDNQNAPTSGWNAWDITVNQSWAASGAGNDMNRTLWVKTENTSADGCPTAETTPVATDVINCKENGLSAAVSAGTVAELPLGEVITYTTGTPLDGSFERLQYQWNATDANSWNDWEQTNPYAYTTDINPGQTLFVRSKISNTTTTIACEDYTDPVETFIIDCSSTSVTTVSSTEAASETEITCVNGEISVTASGAETYTWSDGSSTDASRDLTADGIYTVTGTFANGCVTTADITITVNTTAPTVVISDGSTNITELCVSGGTQSVTASGADTYVWTDDSSTDAARDITAAGSYEVTGTDASNGCTNTATITADIAPAVTGTTTTIDETTCGEYVLSVQVDGNTGTGEWSNTGIGIFGQPTDFATTFTTNTFDEAMTLTWTTDGGECDGSIAVITAQFNQPQTSIDLGPYNIDTECWVWGGLTDSDFGTASNWYKFDGNNWARQTTATPGASDKVYVLGNTNAGLCVSGSNNIDVIPGSAMTDFMVATGAEANLDGSISVSGDITNDGTVNCGTSSVLMNGTADQTVSGNATTLYNMSVNKSSGNLIVSTPITITGTLSMTSGDIANNQTITIGVSDDVTGDLIYGSGVITGQLKRYFANSTGSKFFPVGMAGTERGVTVDFTSSAPGSDQYLTAEYKTGLPTLSGSDAHYSGLPMITSDGQLIQNFHEDGYWEINPGSTSTGDSYLAPINAKGYTISIHGNNLTDASGQHQNKDNVRIIKSSGSNNSSQHHVSWSGLTHVSVTGTDSDFTLNATGTGFSFFGAGSDDDDALPVELISFTGNCADGVIDVTWTTESEFNSAYFDLEKSRDGVTWEVINTQDAAGESTETLVYNYRDVNANSGNNYYRLTQVDIDGTQKTYDVINVNCSETSKGYFSIFPNPSSGSFQVILNNEDIVGSAVMNMTDTKGNVVMKKAIDVKSGINMYVVNEALAPGIYYISVVNGAHATIILKHSVR